MLAESYLSFSHHVIKLNSLTWATPPTQRLIKTLTTLFPQFIHTQGYLALYHTPLHQLLSLTGNTWLFGQKLTSHSDIDAIFKLLAQWASSPAAAQATWHACHLLRHTFISVSDVDKPFRGVSEYWFLYTSTLIVWAFGYRPSTLQPQFPVAQAYLAEQALLRWQRKIQLTSGMPH